MVNSIRQLCKPNRPRNWRAALRCKGTRTRTSYCTKSQLWTIKSLQRSTTWTLIRSSQLLNESTCWTVTWSIKMKILPRRTLISVSQSLSRGTIAPLNQFLFLARTCTPKSDPILRGKHVKTGSQEQWTSHGITDPHLKAPICLSDTLSPETPTIVDLW